MKIRKIKKNYKIIIKVLLNISIIKKSKFNSILKINKNNINKKKFLIFHI